MSFPQTKNRGKQYNEKNPYPEGLSANFYCYIFFMVNFFIRLLQKLLARLFTDPRFVTPEFGKLIATLIRWQTIKLCC